MTREMFSELLQRNKELEEQFVRATDSAMQLLEIDKEHQRINGELREEIERLNNIINELEKYFKQEGFWHSLDKIKELKGSDK